MATITDQLNKIDEAAVALSGMPYELKRAVQEIESATRTAESNDDASPECGRAITRLTVVMDAVANALAALETVMSCVKTS